MRPGASSTEPTHVIRTSVESSRGHRGLPLFSRKCHVGVVAGSSKLASQHLVDDSGLESFEVSVGEVEPVGAHDAAVLVLDFLNNLRTDLLFINETDIDTDQSIRSDELTCQQGVDRPRLDKSNDALLCLL